MSDRQQMLLKQLEAMKDSTSSGSSTQDESRRGQPAEPSRELVRQSDLPTSSKQLASLLKTLEQRERTRSTSLIRQRGSTASGGMMILPPAEQTPDYRMTAQSNLNSEDWRVGFAEAMAELQMRLRCRPFTEEETAAWSRGLARYALVDLKAAVDAYTDKWPNMAELAALAKKARQERLGMVKR